MNRLCLSALLLATGCILPPPDRPGLDVGTPPSTVFSPDTRLVFVLTHDHLGPGEGTRQPPVVRTDTLDEDAAGWHPTRFATHAPGAGRHHSGALRLVSPSGRAVGRVGKRVSVPSGAPCTVSLAMKTQALPPLSTGGGGAHLTVYELATPDDEGKRATLRTQPLSPDILGTTPYTDHQTTLQLHPDTTALEVRLTVRSSQDDTTDDIGVWLDDLRVDCAPPDFTGPPVAEAPDPDLAKTVTIGEDTRPALAILDAQAITLRLDRSQATAFTTAVAHAPGTHHSARTCFRLRLDHTVVAEHCETGPSTAWTPLTAPLPAIAGHVSTLSLEAVHHRPSRARAHLAAWADPTLSATTP